MPQPQLSKRPSLFSFFSQPCFVRRIRQTGLFSRAKSVIYTIIPGSDFGIHKSFTVIIRKLKKNEALRRLQALCKFIFKNRLIPFVFHSCATLKKTGISAIIFNVLALQYREC